MLGRHDLMLAILAAVGVIGCIAVFALSAFQFALFFRSHQVNNFFRNTKPQHILIQHADAT